MLLTFIIIAFLNYGIFAYATSYVPNKIIWGLSLRLVRLGVDCQQKIRQNFLHSMLAVIIFLFLDCVVVVINTYIHLQMNPLIARYLAAGPGTETRERLLGTATFYGVGGYEYFYSLVSIILLLSFLFLNYRKKKYLTLLLIFAFTALLIQSSYLIAIALTFIFLVLLVIMRYTNKYTFIAITLLVIIALLIFQGTFASMFEKLADIEGIPHEISVKFDELALFFSGSDVSGTDLNAR